MYSAPTRTLKYSIHPSDSPCKRKFALARDFSRRPALTVCIDASAPQRRDCPMRAVLLQSAERRCNRIVGGRSPRAAGAAVVRAAVPRPPRARRFRPVAPRRSLQASGRAVRKPGDEPGVPYKIGSAWDGYAPPLPRKHPRRRRIRTPAFQRFWRPAVTLHTESRSRITLLVTPIDREQKRARRSDAFVSPTLWRGSSAARCPVMQRAFSVIETLAAMAR